MIRTFRVQAGIGFALAVINLPLACDWGYATEHEQKLIHVSGPNSVLMLGDELLEGGSIMAAGQNVLPRLIRAGWKIVSIDIVEVREKQTPSGYVLLERPTSTKSSSSRGEKNETGSIR